MSLFDKILGENTHKENSAMSNDFMAAVIENFQARLDNGRYEIAEGYGGTNLFERVMGGGSPNAPYKHGASMFKGPQAKMGSAKGATWDYNPVDVRGDSKMAMPKMSVQSAGMKAKSPTPSGVPVDVRADTTTAMPKLRFHSETMQSPTKTGRSGLAKESADDAANLIEGINSIHSTLLG